MHKAIFIDRDGTLNEMVYDPTHGLLDSPRRVEQVKARPGAGHFVGDVKRLGFMVIVVTNQPGVAKGTMTTADVEAVNHRLNELLLKDGASWDALYYCPHHPEGAAGGDPRYVKTCECRKPKPGLLLDAAKAHQIDLAASWMVGDGLNDIQAGRKAGCRTILVSELKLEQVERFFKLEDSKPDALARNLAEALEIIRSRAA